MEDAATVAACSMSNSIASEKRKTIGRIEVYTQDAEFNTT